MPKFVKKEIDKKKSIGQVAKELGIQTHVIRFWETKFDQIKPVIGKGDRRYYFQKELDILKKIKHFLYDEGYTITGLQKLLSSRNVQNRKDKDLEYIINQEEEFEEFEKEVVSDLSPKLSDSQKKEIESIINDIEIKLQKFQELIQ